MPTTRADRQAARAGRAPVRVHQVSHNDPNDGHFDGLGYPAKEEVGADDQVRPDGDQRVTGQTDARNPSQAPNELERQGGRQHAGGQGHIAEAIEHENRTAEGEMDVGGREGQLDRHEAKDDADHA
ncbi:MAG TPA: hypothetical protein VFY43_08390, partial [Candidatus Limnocylindria bacterium]|nr:hypothetical protein [Candidatus Limnocylindria bacterium]